MVEDPKRFHETVWVWEEGRRAVYMTTFYHYFLCLLLADTGLEF